jgi:hypothetical protein
MGLAFVKVRIYKVGTRDPIETSNLPACNLRPGQLFADRSDGRHD